MIPYTHIYVGKKDCGCTVAVAVDARDKITAQNVYYFIVEGLYIERLNKEQYLKLCKSETYLDCPHGQQNLIFKNSENMLSDNETDVCDYVMDALLMTCILFEFPKDAHGIFMAKQKLISTLDNLSFADVDAWLIRLTKPEAAIEGE